MNNQIKISLLCIVALVASCSGPIDPVKEFTDGEEIRYAGKANDLTYITGRNRLAIQFLLGPDPNVTEAKIYWNLKKKSIDVPIDRSSLVDNTVTQLIESLPEDTYNFEVYTYDRFGNVSVPSYITAKTYGERYEVTLSGRTITDMAGMNTKKDVLLYLGDTIPSYYPVGMEIRYFNTSGQEVVDVVPNSVLDEKGVSTLVSEHLLVNLDYAKPVKYRSLFVPEPNSMDIFSSEQKELTINKSTLAPTPVQLAKPYATHYIENFDQTSTNEAARYDNLWDNYATNVWNSYNGYKLDPATGLATTQPGGSGYNYKGFSNTWRPTKPEDTDNSLWQSPLWVTLDLGEVMRISKVHVYFYYHFVDQFPKENEWWAYTGEGAPKAPVGAETGWENWVKIASTSYDVGNMSEDNKKSVYAAGQVDEFAYTEATAARYYRFVCRKGILYKDSQAPGEQDHWKNTAYSLSEITFWKYDE